MPPQELLETQDLRVIQEIQATQVLLEVRPLQVPQGILATPVVLDLRETLVLQGPEDLQERLDVQILHLELQDRQGILDLLEVLEIQVQQDDPQTYQVLRDLQDRQAIQDLLDEQVLRGTLEILV
jgi:hypothetical protein